jgi:hypothetical protein
MHVCIYVYIRTHVGMCMHVCMYACITRSILDQSFSIPPPSHPVDFHRILFLFFFVFFCKWFLFSILLHSASSSSSGLPSHAKIGGGHCNTQLQVCMCSACAAGIYVCVERECVCVYVCVCSSCAAGIHVCSVCLVCISLSLSFSLSLST